MRETGIFLAGRRAHGLDETEIAPDAKEIT